jgi:hypothetical protein
MSSHHRSPRRIIHCFFISFRQLQVCYFVAPSLTRERVFKLLLVLGMTSGIFLYLSPAGLMNIIFVFSWRGRKSVRKERRKSQGSGLWLRLRSIFRPKFSWEPLCCQCQIVFFLRMANIFFLRHVGRLL